MSRPLSYLLAAALTVSLPALSAAPAAAQAPQSGIQLIGGDWDDDRVTNWKNDRRYWRHGRRHFRHERPGVSFSFGVPFPPVYGYYQPRRSRDCYREWDGSLYCRVR